MRWHIVEGAEGCEFARKQDAVAVIVDALRASATAAMLLDANATRIHCVATVDEARALKQKLPDALLYGERGGLPPEGFDFGNSPREATHAAGREVVFTTTTGTTRLFEAQGAARVLMGSCVNALGVLEALDGETHDVVLIPAGRAGDPEFDADEDWAAAAFIAQLGDADVHTGAAWYREWRQRLEWDGIEHWFRNSPHGQRLIELGFEEDVVFCARPNLTGVVPEASKTPSDGMILQRSQR